MQLCTLGCWPLQVRFQRLQQAKGICSVLQGPQKETLRPLTRQEGVISWILFQKHGLSLFYRLDTCLREELANLCI